jgi:hypothetical protein
MNSNKRSRSCPAGLEDRCRDESGEIRRKRSDTLVGTLRREYGDDFAKGFRSDASLATVLRETNSESLSEYLRRRQPAPGRPATARDTARALGVSGIRADRLIRTVSGEIRDSRTSRFVFKKKTSRTHAETKARKTKTNEPRTGGQNGISVPQHSV